MNAALEKLRRDLGAAGLLSLTLMAAVAAFNVFVLRPLEADNLAMQRELDMLPRENGAALTRVSARAGAPAGIDAFYRFFDRRERSDEWLAKLYGIATASGLVLRAGDYRLLEARERLERYQLTLPLSGTYSQIRNFTEGALAEIPVLSLDQISFRRKGASEAKVEAELVFTLYLPRR